MKYICVIEEISNFDFIYFLWNCPAGGGGIWHIATASKWNAIPASSNLTPFCLLPPPRFQTVSPRCYITSRRKGGGRGEMGRALIDNRFPSRENLFLRFWMKRKSKKGEHRRRRRLFWLSSCNIYVKTFFYYSQARKTGFWVVARLFAHHSPSSSLS